MPDRRRHRGRHPADQALFAPERLPALHEALDDLCWLLGRGYSDKAAIALVGDRYQLRTRQRIAIRRCACSDSARSARLARKRDLDAVRDRELAIDGFNCVVTLEAAISGGLVLVGRDHAHRDLASVHGSYRQVAETQAALAAIAAALDRARPRQVRWYLDRPVSNSGRLAALIRELGHTAAQPWLVELVDNPDRALVARPEATVASSDAWVLDQAEAWLDLPGEIIARGLTNAGDAAGSSAEDKAGPAPTANPWVVDLSR
ncbi:DUF434 domain-containing protein [Haliangium sp.]|uniref:DUF434 domain-containing protein n=1 Tax=Haliangium sp. TaxID=2663208 RepID=UPI003D0BE4F3